MESSLRTDGIYERFDARASEFERRFTWTLVLVLSMTALVFASGVVVGVLLAGPR